MGYFARFTYSDGAWVPTPSLDRPQLVVDVHDSDVATIDHRTADGVTGRFFLGYEPRAYFDDGDADPPVDRPAAAAGFARWVREVEGREVDPARVEELLASGDPDDDPEDVFVEQTVERLLVLAGIPVPEELADGMRGDA
ncbi:hypothetical protein GB931_09905 [Modestobacter sp. I12A-02628]|uniref:Uncharacterized protein n=1 Tax=Goekera deserti TaxID=2497753 RepID=A0A7K3WBG1_9ACTN|nr:hypothetical protein [Goekera deserti]MPQ98227.1 hypothetical protein [Goekera deserti]NDI48053.1 hypothetical protein [Goekera deserti]NEL53801.1 hypothetical protein [Goekera deserti]